MKNFKTVLFTTMPFILFGVYNGLSAPFFSDDPQFMRILILSLLGASALMVLLQRAVKNSLYFPSGMLVLMGVFAGIIFALPANVIEYKSALQLNKAAFFILQKPMAGLFFIYGCIALFPQLFQKPSFTEYFARMETPEMYWKTRRFKRINAEIGYFWALVFFLSGVSQFIPNTVINIIIPVVLNAGIGIMGTKYLRKLLMTKYAHLDNDNRREFLKTGADVVKSMPFAFNAKNAEGINAVFQYCLTGENAFNGYLEIKNGICNYTDGVHPKPDLTVKSPDNVWYQIAMGEMTGAEAFMKQLYQVEGDFSLLMKMDKLFGGSEPKPSPAGMSAASNNTGLNSGFQKKYVPAKPGEIKKIVAIQASPRNNQTSKTEIVLQSFLKGCKEAGAEVETIYLREKTIEHCIGCYSCWTKTPGKCIHQDDAEEITKKIYTSDCVIYASPLYHFNVYSLLKKYMERTLPVLYPYLVPRADGATTHPLREGYKTPYTVIMGVCGFPEVSHFDAFSHTFHKLAQAGDGKIIAEIYRPASETLAVPIFSEMSRNVLKTLQTAGKELITTGTIRSELTEEIARMDYDVEQMRQQANLFWDTCITEGKLPGQIQEAMVRN